MAYSDQCPRLLVKIPVPSEDAGGNEIKEDSGFAYERSGRLSRKLTREINRSKFQGKPTVENCLNSLDHGCKAFIAMLSAISSLLCLQQDFKVSQKLGVDVWISPNSSSSNLLKGTLQVLRSRTPQTVQIPRSIYGFCSDMIDHCLPCTMLQLDYKVGRAYAILEHIVPVNMNQNCCPTFMSPVAVISSWLPESETGGYQCLRI